MPSVLFVCQGNVFRSQMAEAFFNAWAPQGWTAASAGTHPKRTEPHPVAVDLMAEMGIDMSAQRPKRLDLAVAASAWRVIAMCDIRDCPVEVSRRMERWDIADPADLPESRWPEIRDDIAERVKALLRELAHGGPAASD